MSNTRYTPAETARLRALMIEQDFVPAVRSAFANHPDLQSAVMLVAQYWCDEALDAVHHEVLFSKLPAPDIAAAYAARKEAYESENFDAGPKPEPVWQRWLPWLKPQPEQPSSHPTAVRQRPAEVNLPTNLDPENLDRDYIWQIEWDSNGEAIPLFAAFCLEGCDQEMDPEEAYTPYAIFRRRGAEIEVEVVGVMHRPWLDGIAPEGEDDA